MIKMELFIILVCLIGPPAAISLSVHVKLNSRVVQLRNGKIQGLEQSFENKGLKPVDVYLGIPYATPPIGGDRFSPTKAPSPWKGIRMANKVGPVCPQKLPKIADETKALERMPKGRLEYLKKLLPHLSNQSEDCLYLNIYAPAMAYMLADAGYDIWVTNVRGNTHGRSHVQLSPDEPAFWNFTLHDIATKDLPAQIDFILAETGQSCLVYIGHSMGTTLSYILLSELPKYNGKISLLMSLAPVVLWRYNGMGALKKFGFETFVKALHKLTKSPDYAVEIMSRRNPVIEKSTNFCDQDNNKMCKYFMNHVYGLSGTSLNSHDIKILSEYAPAGTSLKIIEHYRQQMHSGSSESSKRHPVLLYIHGESYDWGSGNPYDGSVLASYTDQVVVTINYRLGVLGFLNANISPQIKARVANYGLMDQLAALHWVQENIALFGGDPGNITLMGHGTGAACVNFLAISPTVIPGLFKRAILLSGSALSSWAVVEDPVTYAVRLAKAVNCTVPNDLLKEHELIVDCLRDTRLDDLMSADVEPPTFLSAFGPSVDGVVIKPDFQKDLLSYLGPEFQGYGQLPRRNDPGTPITSNNKYDLLFGVTTSEALWRFAEHDVQSGFEGERRDRIIRTYVRNAYTYHLTEIFYTIVNEYTEWERTTQHPSNTRDGCVQALSDAQFVAPLVQTGDLFTLRHAKKPNNPHLAPIPDHEREPMPKTYFYVFDFQTKDNDYPEKMGIVQGEDLPYIFGAPLVDGFNHFRKNYTRSEIAMSESIIQAFESFIKTGNPNVLEYHGNKADGQMPLSRERNKFRSITWEQYDPVHQKYLEITKKPTIKNHFRAHQLSVWLRLIPELHRAGMEDVEPRHNLFRSHSDPNLYDGLVRPDPLSRMGEEYRRRNFTTELPTTTDYSITTCVSVIPSTNLQNVHNASSPDTLSGPDVAGYSAYSTALSVTIAIGCSLLILNVLIFAGVYYQRDKTRLEVKSLQQQQMMNQQCGPRGFTELKQPPPPHSHFTSSGQVIVDVENEMLRRNVIKASNEGGLLQGQSTHTLPHQHHYQKQQHTQHATLPRTSVIQEMGMQSQCPPNGSIHLTVPRAPPPPRTKSPPENQPLLQSGNIINRVTQGSMTEMRV